MAITIGALLTLLIIAAMIATISDRTALAFAAYITGMLVAVPGILAIKGWRIVRRWLDM